jgi:hypothetical protein
MIGVSLAARLEPTIERIRAIESAHGIDRASMKAIGEVLLAAGVPLLGELVGLAAITRRAGWGRRLTMDVDHRFALYLVSEAPGATSEPHEHKTWQVTACLAGAELHRLYERPVGESRRVVRHRELRLEPGDHLGTFADEIHATVVVSKSPTVHLQVYGADLELLPPLAARSFLE